MYTGVLLRHIKSIRNNGDRFTVWTKVPLSYNANFTMS